MHSIGIWQAHSSQRLDKILQNTYLNLGTKSQYVWKSCIPKSLSTSCSLKGPSTIRLHLLYLNPFRNSTDHSASSLLTNSKMPTCLRDPVFLSATRWPRLTEPKLANRSYSSTPHPTWTSVRHPPPSSSSSTWKTTTRRVLIERFFPKPASEKPGRRSVDSALPFTFENLRFLLPRACHDPCIADKWVVVIQMGPVGQSL